MLLLNTDGKQDPIIIVGDDRGGVNSLKLSPNLRKVRLGATKQNKSTHERLTFVAYPVPVLFYHTNYIFRLVRGHQ